MSVVFDVYTPDEGLILTSKTKPQGFHYRFEHDVEDKSLGDKFNLVCYTGLRTNPRYSKWLKIAFRETFGGLSDSAIAKYPKFQPSAKNDINGDGHNHHYLTGGCLAWVCAPNGIYRTWHKTDGIGYSASAVSGGTYPKCSMIVTGSQPNIEEGYLTQYNDQGEVMWTITHYFRHPHVQHVWVKPVGYYTGNQVRAGTLTHKDMYDGWRDWKLGAGGYMKYVSTDGHPLYACVTLGSQCNRCGPVFRWNEDGTVLEVVYEGDDVYTSDYGTYSEIQINVPIASFPYVTKDFY